MEEEEEDKENEEEDKEEAEEEENVGKNNEATEKDREGEVKAPVLLPCWCCCASKGKWKHSVAHLLLLLCLVVD